MQPVHCAPPVPHAFGSLPGWHAPLPSQQPFGQFAGPQVEPMHVPWLHCAVALHVAHTVPLPHAATVSPRWQMPCPSQHPFGQVLELQVEATQDPAWQTAPRTHSEHAAPVEPHAESVFPFSHAPFAPQQPPGHVAGPHACIAWQNPPRHVEPGGHDEQKLPDVPHAPALLPGWQAPFWSQHPLGHVCESHARVTQTPSVHWPLGPQFAQR